MKPLILILLLLLSFTAAAAEAQQVRRPGPQATIHRQQLHGSQAMLHRHQLEARPPTFHPRPQQRAVVNCGIGRWVDNVFTCQAGPVERALDRLNDTIGNDYSAIQMQQWAIQSAAEANAQAQIEAANKAASDAAYYRSITPVFGPPAGLGPIPDEKIYKRVGPNGIVTYSNVQ